MRITTNPFRQPMLQMLMKYIATVVFTLFFNATWATTEAYDSIGVEEVGDKVFILHKVEMTETLYSVSRRYNVSIYKIIENNPPTEFGLEVGQIIKIPYQVKAIAQHTTSTQTTTSSQSESGGLTHEVAMKETLYSISKQYGATVEEIKRWNNLQSNSIDIGQQLIVKKNTTLTDSKISQSNVIIGNQDETHVVAQSETLYSLSKRYDVPVASIMKWNDLTSPEISIGQELIVGQTTLKDQRDTVAVKTSSVVKSDSIKLATTSIDIDSTLNPQASVKDERMNNPVTSSTDFEEVVESGVASLIEGSEGTRKYLALHRTAKVGTIMRVHNEMNGQEVFVRVLGKLPDTGINKNVVIRISKSAYDRLGAIDPSFRVTVSYIP